MAFVCRLVLIVEWTNGVFWSILCLCLCKEMWFLGCGESESSNSLFTDAFKTKPHFPNSVTKKTDLCIYATSNSHNFNLKDTCQNFKFWLWKGDSFKVASIFMKDYRVLCLVSLTICTCIETQCCGLVVTLWWWQRAVVNSSVCAFGPAILSPEWVLLPCVTVSHVLMVCLLSSFVLSFSYPRFLGFAFVLSNSN